MAMIGRRFAHYVIVDTIAAGGMGVVYRARDEHLEREVAIKVLPPEALGRPVARRRFRREALALSKLKHPNIAVVHDFSEQEGVSFLVMELVEGESLAARLARGPLPESEVRRIGAQIAAALEAAHKAGVVHRDLKPANVMIGPDGDAKVLDFGVAQLAAPGDAADPSTSVTGSLTATGMAVGTVPYMAPEQLLGRDVDARADIHALGVLLHEMAAGRRPWRETLTTALIFEIANMEPPPLRDVRPEVSAELDAIVTRCLAKFPEERFASADEVRGALAASDPGSYVLDSRARRARVIGRNAAWLAGAAIVLAFAAYLLLDLFRTGGANGVSSLAVLPLENLSADPAQDYFVNGMTDELINRLTQLSTLRVIARPSVMSYRGTTKSLQQIADELGVATLVTGSVLLLDDRVRISAQLANGDNGENLWADSFDGRVDDVLALQGRVARAVAEKIRVQLNERERSRLAQSETVDPDAHQAYLRGRYYLDWTFSSELARSLEYFEQAIRFDPQYAPAYAGLAEAYTLMSNVYMPSVEALSKAKAAALRAIDQDSTVVGAWAALAYVQAFYEWHWDEAGRTFARALELNPGRASTRRDHGIYLLCRGRIEEAEAEIQQAWTLDPLSAYTTTVRLFPLYEDRRFDEAIATARGILQADSGLVSARMILGQSLLMSGETAAGLGELSRASAQDGGVNPVLRAWLGYALERNGRRDEALAILHDLENVSPSAYVNPVAPALLSTALGDNDRALAWLERAVEQRYEDVCLVHLDAGFDPLRTDPRFARVLAPVGLVGKEPGART